MEQLTEEQAIAFNKSKVWQSWTDEQIVRFQLFQERICVPYLLFNRALSGILGRPVYTHEFSNNYDGIVQEYLGTKEPPTLEEIINLIPAEKRVVIGLRA